MAGVDTKPPFVALGRNDELDALRSAKGATFFVGGGNEETGVDWTAEEDPYNEEGKDSDRIGVNIGVNISGEGFRASEADSGR